MPGPGFAPEDRMPEPVPTGSSRRLRRPPICTFCEGRRYHAHRPIEMAGGLGDLGPVACPQDGLNRVEQLTHAARAWEAEGIAIMSLPAVACSLSTPVWGRGAQDVQSDNVNLETHTSPVSGLFTALRFLSPLI